MAKLPPVSSMTVEHRIPDGQRVSIEGISKLAVQLFGNAALRKAGVPVFDRDGYEKSLDERARNAGAKAE